MSLKAKLTKGKKLTGLHKNLELIFFKGHPKESETTHRMAENIYKVCTL